MENKRIEASQEGDTISRQAALDALVDENIIDHMDTVYDYEFRRCKRAIVRILAQLPSAQPEQPKSCNECENFNKTMRLIYSAQPERRWIPCGEKLPEIDKEVLVTDGEICWICSLFESPDIEDGFHQWEDNYGHWHEFDAWIAWMPLPEPYEERREEP